MIVGINHIKQLSDVTDTVEKLEREELMDWNNIYIVGNRGFKKDVARKLEHSDLNFMPGYLGADLGATDYDMYWVDKKVTLRDFKLAITAKYIWKYRLRFYDSLEKFIASQNKEENNSLFTPEDKALMSEMREGPRKKSLAA